MAPWSGRDDADDPWILRFDVSLDNRRVIETLTALSNGSFGTRGLLDHEYDVVPGSTMAAGIYDSGDMPTFLTGPRWSVIELARQHHRSEVARLDLLTGVLRLEIDGEDGPGRIEAELFSSVVRNGVHALRITGPISAIDSTVSLRAPEPQAEVESTVESDAGGDTQVVVTGRRGVIAATASQTVVDHASGRTLERLAVFEADGGHPDHDLGASTAARLAETEAIGFDRLRAEHGDRWRERWRLCAIDLPTRPDLERSIRFAQYHLLASSIAQGEVAIGARGLTGPAYRGHVFWDTDVFVVPALTAMAPELARSALRYRVNRLPAARQRAAEEGRAGARFPWESARSGIDVTPTEGPDLHGGTRAILTGGQEEHIVADVAWSVIDYHTSTGDDDFLHSGGAEIVVDTARYWQSRVERDDDGSGHIRGVIGPDEYHEAIDDNAFTNQMARWNLHAGAEVGERLGVADERERQSWRATAESLVDGYDESAGIHVQFEGFGELEPVMVTSIGSAPLPADVLLGRRRIQETQIIKQADVLMLQHMLPDAVRAGSLVQDLDYYLPRTAHGSSLSPAITAAVLARAGRPTDAMRWFELAASFDIDDISGTTPGGLHLATMGGLWQALARGFVGVRPTQNGLLVDPRVPRDYGTITLRIWYRSVPVRIDASAERFEVTSPVGLTVLVPGAGRCDGRRIGAVRLADDGDMTWVVSVGNAESVR